MTKANLKLAVALWFAGLATGDVGSNQSQLGGRHLAPKVTKAPKGNKVPATKAPTPAPTPRPTPAPIPVSKATKAPKAPKKGEPTIKPTSAPTIKPTSAPTKRPSAAPSPKPSLAPSAEPSVIPTINFVDYGLDADVAPSENFDLLGWYLGVPVPDDDGFASEIYETDLAAGYESQYFFTGSDGAMVFWTNGHGVRTSENTKFLRSELRAMLRRGDTTIKTKDPANNWAFSTIPECAQPTFGGIDGELTATLAVNHVMTTGTDINWQGRIIIGQIHAEDNEPCRLYYQKLPNNTKGSIYFGHELSPTKGGGDIFYNLLGNMVEDNPEDPMGVVQDASDPEDGIALNEKFSYSILVEGDYLTVTILQDGTQLAQQVVDMSDSGYGVVDDFQYFKAGLYLQDNTFDAEDYAQVSFYELEYTHNYDLYAGSGKVTIVSAADWGTTVAVAGQPASGAIDGSTGWTTRWAANLVNGVEAVNLLLDVGSDKAMTGVGIAWGKGDDYSHIFEIRYQVDGGSDWIKVYAGSSSGTTESFETYDIGDVVARYIRIKISGNTAGETVQIIKELEIYNEIEGCPSDEPTAAPSTSGTASDDMDYGLDADVAPSENFDLLGWYLGVPVPDDDGFASEIYETDLAAGYESQYFFTGSDGAMVFWTNGHGVRTSENTKFLRSELRAMLRRGDTTIKTKDPANNWAFSTIPECAQPTFGGIDGELTATLAVNHVMTTGTDINWQGRIIIGQIHAEDNEPCRLYYQKLPNNTKGSIYFGHELSPTKGGGDIFYNLLGNMVEDNPEDPMGVVQDASDPEDGIALNEKFSYSILVEGDYLTVTILQDGTQLAQQVVDMSDSGYGVVDDFQYFKAGLYLQDNTFDAEDYAQVSFYELEYTHNYDLYAGSGKVTIVSAADWGTTVAVAGQPASGAIDGSTGWTTRWAANLVNGVEAVNLLLDVGSDKAMTGVGIAWGKGDDYSHIFEIRYQVDGGSDWIKVYAGSSSGTTESFETYDIGDVVARYIRIKISGNTAGETVQIIKELEIYNEIEGCPSDELSPEPSAAPSASPSMCVAGSSDVTIVSASDMSGTVAEAGQPASGAIDGSTDWATRWAAKLINGVDAVNLMLDVGSNQDMTTVAIAWGNGDDYSHNFEIRYKVDGGSDWIKVYSGSSSGTTESFESYGIGDISARYIRIKIFGNTAGDIIQIIKEVEIYNEIENCPSSAPSAVASTAPSASPSMCVAGSSDVTIVSASDMSGTVAEAGQPASGAIDGSTDWATRWAAKLINGVDAVNLMLDVGSNRDMTTVAIAWGNGDDYSHNFEIRYKVDGGSDWIKVYSGSSSGTTESFESYGIGDISARYIRIKIFGNTAGDIIQNIKEVEIYKMTSCP